MPPFIEQLPPAGARDRLIEIQQAVQRGKKTDGTPIYDWIPYAKEWAKAEPMAGFGSELFGSQQFFAETDSLFRFPYVAGLTSAATFRISYDGRLYDIKGVRELGRRAGHAVAATARAE